MMPFHDVEDAIAQLDKIINTAVEVGTLKRLIKETAIKLEEQDEEEAHGRAIALLQAYDDMEKRFKENAVILLEYREWLNEARLRVEHARFTSPTS